MDEQFNQQFIYRSKEQHSKPGQMLNIIASLVLIYTVMNPVIGQLTYLTSILQNGARYPINDLFDANQTNSVGIRQQYLLGSYFHQDYINQQQFIPKKPNPKSIEILSASTQRSVDSAVAHLFGLFPIGTGWAITQQVPEQYLYPPFQSNTQFSHLRTQIQQAQFALNLGFQPFPIYIADDILNNCSKYGVLFSKRYQQVISDVSRLQAEHTVFIAKLKLVFNLTNLQVTLPTIVSLYDTIVSDLALGRPIPKQIDSANLKQWKFINNYYNALLFSNSFAQVIASPLLTRIIQSLWRTANAQNDKKWSIISANQNNLLPIMWVLNLTSSSCIWDNNKNGSTSELNCMEPPTFSSNLLIQLHQDDAFQYFVKLKYNGQYAYMCGTKKYDCRLSQFKERVEKSLKDYVKQCN